jgi:Uma2 family endonuclease
MGTLLEAPRRDLIPAPALERNFRMAAIPLEHPVFYPESDGQPMGETPLHRREMSYLIGALEERFRRAADVYVSGNMFLYYEPGRPRSVVAPDVFVARGIVDKDRERRVYKLWEEAVGPCLVIEVTSNATRDEDLGDKKSLYERLGVVEYFLYDPEGDFLPERLRGFRLEGGRYFPFRRDDDGALASRTTGVTLRLEGGRVRVFDTATERPFLRPEEAADVVQAAEEEIARLKAEIARLRGGG